MHISNYHVKYNKVLLRFLKLFIDILRVFINTYSYFYLKQSILKRL